MQDAPARLGDYLLLDPLGSGGFGSVHLAQHVETGERVAIKTVRGSRVESLASIRREIFALSRLQHPGVVQIRASGVESGLPWYAMELLEGQTLSRFRAALIDASTGTIPPSRSPVRFASNDATLASSKTIISHGAAEEPAHSSSPGSPAMLHNIMELLAVIRRLCVPLAYLHGEGIVHRDLKPDNILVSADGLPVLVDFGLVTRTASGSGRETLEQGGDVSGTIAYMAPEQVRGEYVDARADLYALGCILYELVTGRAPFVAERAIDVLKMHLREKASPPSLFAREVPAQLDDLILKLLEKEPAKRLGHAGDVARRLGSIGVANGGTESMSIARNYLYRPGFVGRQGMMDALAGHLNAAEDRIGGIVLLGGESGAGKTRILKEIVVSARQRGMRVALGECLPVTGAREGGSGPLQGWRGFLIALADICREAGRESAARILADHGPLLALYEPSFGTLLGDAAATEPPPLAPSAARLRLFRALTHALEVMAAPSLLVVLDDIQWADDLTLGFLKFLADGEHLKHKPILVIGAYRKEETTVELDAITRLRGVSILELDRLDRSDVAQMSSEMLALPLAPSPLIDHLSTHSEGNPFFVAEYLRAAVDLGILARDVGGRWQVAGGEDGDASLRRALGLVPLPGSLRALVGRRLAGLGASAFALCEVAAVLGREMSAALLQSAADIDDDSFLQAVGELVARQVLDDAGATLRFLHDKLREAAYDGIAPERLPGLHRKAAQVLMANLAPEQQAERQAELARHWELCGDRARARPAFLAAARRATLRNDHNEAERLYRQSLAQVEINDSAAIETRGELGEMLVKIGRTALAEIELQRALADTRARCDRAAEAHMLRRLTVLHRIKGELATAAARGEEAVAISQELGDARGVADALSSLAVVQQNQGRMQLAQASYERALESFRALGHERSELHVLINLACVHLDAGAHAVALALYDQVLPRLRAKGLRSAMGVALGNIGVLHHRAGRRVEARRAYEECLAIYREFSNPQGVAVTVRCLADMSAEEGDFEEALRLYAEAVARYTEVGDRRGEGTTLVNQGALARRMERIDDCRALLERATDLARGVGDPRVESGALEGMAELDLALGRITEAHAKAERALEILRASGAHPSEASLLILLAETIRQSGGDLDECARLLDRAFSLLSENGVPLGQARCMCARGRLELARGGDAQPYLEEARRHAGVLALMEGSPIAHSIAALEQAMTSSRNFPPPAAPTRNRPDR